MSDPHILLAGEQLALGMPRQDLLPEYHQWENDARTILGYGNQWAQSWEVRAAGYSEAMSATSSSKSSGWRT